mgnify:CR=1 FL=1
MRLNAGTLVLVCLLLAGTAPAGTVGHTLTVAPGDVVISGNDSYTVVGLELERAGTVRSWTAVPGEPLLPVISGNVLIPAGAEVEAITAVPLERAELGSYQVHPVQPMRPLSQFENVPFVSPDLRVYLSDEVFPAEPLVAVPAGNKSGYRVAGFLYCPFEYRPASGRLTLVTKVRIEVRYREHAAPVTVLTPGQNALFRRDVAELVVNPRDVARMAPPVAEMDVDEIDVVMFTSATLAPALSGLRDWLVRKGYFTEIVRHDTLSTPGRDTQEKMRNLVKQLYAERGLKYVILAGNYQHCPVRYGYLPYTTYNVPADMYFGDLDGSWDANNNGNFGEMDGDSVDLFHDVYVGRLPFSTAANVANFLHKDTTYEKTPDGDYLDDVLLPHEVLWANIDYHGGIVNRNIAILLNERSPWQVDSGLNMNSSRAISALNAGRQHMHFAGHGSENAFGSTFSTSHIPSLTNIGKPTIVTSMACHCGWFDRSASCLGELLVNATNGGAVATMLNARYGWGAPPCQGPNENLNCQIYHNFQKALTLGQAHGLARDFLRNESFSQMSTRWAMYTNTLQGDPMMRVWREVPVTPVLDYAAEIPAMPQTYPVLVSGGDGPVAGARVALTHQGELVGRGVAGDDGVAYVQLPAVEDTWTLTLSVSGPDIEFTERTVTIAAGGAASLVVFDRAVVDSDNGRLDPGDEVPVFFVVRNRGNAAADSVAGQLGTTSPWVTIIEDEAAYGAVGIGDTARGTAYTVRVAADCPHAHPARFTLTTTAADGEATSSATLIVGLPHGRGGNWATLDTGDYVLSVMNNGGIGSTEWRGEGFGFVYPKTRTWSNSALMHGSFMLGTDTSWVVDNYYGAPDWKRCPLDFEPGDSVRPVHPPELGDKQFIASFSDANHPEPRGVVVTHRVYGSARPTHRDFVILEYRLHNTGTGPLENLHVAAACDFRTGNWDVNDIYDYAGTDSARIVAWNRAQPETTALGIRPIYPRGMTGWANCIFHNTHINDGFTKAEKMGFMDGTLRQTTGTTQGRWHAMASSGPYHIPAGDSQIVAFALVGGRTVAGMLVNSDTAAAWYDPPVGVAENPGRPVPHREFAIGPRLVIDGLRISYQGLAPGREVAVAAFDASGRYRAGHRFTTAGASGTFDWRPPLTPGVYFIRVGDESEKVLKLR